MKYIITQITLLVEVPEEKRGTIDEEFIREYDEDLKGFFGGEVDEGTKVLVRSHLTDLK